jgi:hypothetical protein
MLASRFMQRERALKKRELFERSLKEGWGGGVEADIEKSEKLLILRKYS